MAPKFGKSTWKTLIRKSWEGHEDTHHAANIIGLSHWETHDNSTTYIITYVDIKEVFLVKEWNSSHLSGKKLGYLHLKDFHEYKCELYLKQPLTPPQHKIIAAYHTSNHDLLLKLDNVKLSLSSMPLFLL